MALSRQRLHQLERRKKGLCAVEGCPNVSGKHHYCTEHKAAHRKANQVWRRQRAAAKLDAR